ncbi:MAG: hypothetical protein J7L23_04955 [Candidatus Diapherotrites archaeon]|nr:hypothetical protein [Candidatus Diapherotrites archaeon]
MEYGTKSCFGKLKRVLMHKPGEELELITDPSVWGFRARPNWKKASEEMDKLINVLKEEGVKVDLVEVGPDVPPPNLYFTKDLGVCSVNGLVLSYFRHEYRQGEELFLEAMGDRLGIPVFGRIINSYFEGGDFVQITDDVIAVGLNNRTNQDGFEQLCEFFNKVMLPVFHKEETHLDSIFGIVDDSLAVAYEPSLPAAFKTFLSGRNFELISLKDKQEFAPDFITLEPDKVIIDESCNELNNVLEDYGVDVIKVGVSELKKGSGGPGSFILTLLRK